MNQTLSIVLGLMALGRILLGVAPFVAARPASRLMGFPAEQDVPAARLMARLFGVRDIGLGVLVGYAIRHPEALTFVLLFNAAMDLGDIVSALIPIAKRQGIDRGAITTGLFAFGGMSSWLIVWGLFT